MSGDPVECREQAKACADMAGKARNPDHARILTNLAQTWLNLAIELERNHALFACVPGAGDDRDGQCSRAFSVYPLQQ